VPEIGDEWGAFGGLTKGQEAEMATCLAPTQPFTRPGSTTPSLMNKAWLLANAPCPYPAFDEARINTWLRDYS